MQTRPRSRLRPLRGPVGLVVTVVATVYLARVVDGAALRASARAVGAHPGDLLLALAAYAAAFWLRVVGWRRVVPSLSRGHAWAALHVSLLGNHVLPLRLGEALRVTSVVRRTSMPTGVAAASVLALRSADLLAVLVLAAVGSPRLLDELVGGAAPAIGAALLLVVGAGGVWLRRLRARSGAELRLPGPAVAVTALAAWCLESVVMWQAAQWSGIHLSPAEAVAVTAVTIAAQTVAVTPGGFGSYEAAATAALVVLGASSGPALAAAITAHAVKTAYSLAVGSVALFLPSPGYWGRWRLPAHRPARPPAELAAPTAPVVVFLPAHDEEAVVGDVVRRIPTRVAGRSVEVLVVDDGSTDDTAARAEEAGAVVLRVLSNRGLGAAVRRGLAEASALGPAVVVYLDADGEYPPEEIEALVAPVLDGTADYVVGSRFAGTIEVMRPHRRVGNRVLTGLLRRVAREPITDGQSGMRAFSPEAARAAEVIHDYNYAQVLTLDLLAKGFRYAEVPITYRFRETGRSFVRLGTYLRRVLPAVHREVNGAWAELAVAERCVAENVAAPAGVVEGGSVLDDVAREPLARR